MDHSITRETLLPNIIQLIMDYYKLDENQALHSFYTSATGIAFSEDDTGLYGQSALYIFGLYRVEMDEMEQDVPIRK